MKKWVDADLVIKMVTDLEDNRLREYRYLMEEKPNFNHTEAKKNKKRKKVQVRSEQY